MIDNLPAVLDRPELAPESQAPAILDAEYRELSRREMSRHDRQHSPSVVLPAGLVALAVFTLPIAVYAALVWSSSP